MPRVPHMSLYGKFVVSPKDRDDVVRRIAKYASGYCVLPFTVDGFVQKTQNKTNGKKVIALKVVPSKELGEFRRDLARDLLPLYPSQKSQDYKDDFWFHITLANDLPDSEFKKVWSHLEKNRGFISDMISSLSGHEPRSRHPLLLLNGMRITLLEDYGLIYKEYDLAQKLTFNRHEALDKFGWCDTFKMYRIQQGIELAKPNMGLDKTQNTFCIGDLHFDHQNIIRYCGRPFCNIEDMNDVLVKNWNLTVTDQDRAFILGDLTCNFGRVGSGHSPNNRWVEKLNGHVTLLKGNHDDKSTPILAREIIHSEAGLDFLLIHDPDPNSSLNRENGNSSFIEQWKGWIIHGDKHNDNLGDYPFFLRRKKRINVSAELVDYKPVDLHTIESIIEGPVQRMDTIRSPGSSAS